MHQASASVPARTRSPGCNSRSGRSPCLAARGIKLLAAHRGGTQSQGRALLLCQPGSGSWDEPAAPLPTEHGSSARFPPRAAVLTWLLCPCSPELSPDFSVLFLEMLLQTKELELEQLPPGTEMPLPWGLRCWGLCSGDVESLPQ